MSWRENLWSWDREGSNAEMTILIKLHGQHLHPEYQREMRLQYQDENGKPVKQGTKPDYRFPQPATVAAWKRGNPLKEPLYLCIYLDYNETHALKTGQEAKDLRIQVALEKCGHKVVRIPYYSNPINDEESGMIANQILGEYRKMWNEAK